MDSLAMRNPLYSVSRESYGNHSVGASVSEEGHVGISDPGIEPEPSGRAVVGSYTLWRGRKVFEQARDTQLAKMPLGMGNVLAVVSDVKLGVSTVNTLPSLIDYYTAEPLSSLPDFIGTGRAGVVEMSDYEPAPDPRIGWMLLAKRHWVSGEGYRTDSYRYGFQAQEGDDEWSGEGNMLAFKYRVHDARLGRFLSIDPLAPEYPWNSPYAFSENRNLDGIVLEGLERVGSTSIPVESIGVSSYLTYEFLATAKVRQEYVTKAALIDPMNGAARSALKTSIRAKTPPMMRSLVKTVRPGVESKTGNLNSANKTNAGVNRGASLLGKTGNILFVASVSAATYNVATAENKSEAFKEQSGAICGGLVGGIVGAELFSFIPGGAIVGGFVGGYYGSEYGSQVGPLLGASQMSKGLEGYQKSYPLDQDHPENLIYHICFIKGTLVQTPIGLAPIESIQTGDSVLSIDLQNNRPRINIVTSTIGWKAGEICRIETSDQQILVTSEHPIYVIGVGWKMAGAIREGDVLRTMQGEMEKVEYTDVIQEWNEVYNIVVDRDHNYFVTSSRILVHNKSVKQDPKSND